MPGNTGGLPGIGITADRLLAFRERKAAPVRGEPAGRSSGVWFETRRRLARKGVPKGVNRTQKMRVAGRISDALPHFIDDAREAGVRHEHSRPDPSDQLRLRQRAGPHLDEELQQFVGLRRQVHLVAAALQLTRVRIEKALAEADPHDTSIRKHEGIRQDFARDAPPY